MKEKMKNWIYENRKRIIGICSAVAMVFLIIGVCLVEKNSVNVEATEKQASITETTSKKSDEEKGSTKKVVSKETSKETAEKTNEGDTKTADKKDTEEKKSSETDSGTKKNDKAITTGNSSKTSEKTNGAATNNSGSSTTTTGSSDSKPTTNNNSKPSGSTESTSANNNSGTTQTTPTQPDKPQHTHNWVEQTTIVHHDATGHNETYVVTEAWDETVTEWVYDPWECCNVCGADCTGDGGAHMKEHALAGEGGGRHTEYYKQVTYTVHHDAVYGTRWVQDTAAWDETVVTGYACSCGATK